VVLVGIRLLSDDGLLGSGAAETYGHAWRQWWIADALPGWATGPGDLLWTATELPLIDPLPTLIAASIGSVFGVEFGYNAWILGSVFLAFAGGVCLAQRLGGDPWTGGVVLALSPPLLGSLSSGLTEDGAVGLLAMAMALIGHRDWRRGAAGGALLGLSAFCGLVLAWGGGIMASILGVGILARHRERWKSLAAGAAAAVIVALPAALLQGDRLTGEGHRLGSPVPGPEPLWPLNPWRGVDLASYLRPGPFSAGDAIIRTHPAWLGAIAILLAALAIWKLRGRVAALGVVFLLMILWAPGDDLSWAGQPTGVHNPFTSVMDLLPFGDLINHHGRLLILASLALSGLASLGAIHLGGLTRRLPGLIVIELLLLSPISPMLAVAPSQTPDVLEEITDLSEGPLLVLPISGPGVHFQRPFLDQRSHGRTLVSDPQRPGLPSGMDDGWSHSPTALWMRSLAHCQEGAEETHHMCSAPVDVEPPPGVAVIFASSDYRARVEEGLGEPTRAGSDGAVWELNP
jgi:hypothetical protein